MTAARRARRIAWIAALALAGGVAPAGHARALPQAEPDEAAAVAEIVRRGRELLAQGDARAAEQVFIEAEVRSGKAVGVRKWIWRAWMESGRINDALDATDAAAGRGELPQADLDYLRGMAFFFRGRDYVEQKVGEPFTSLAFRDAMEWLDAALRADPEQYHDAWIPLAECAWQVREYAIGRPAAEEALRRFPDDARGALLLGRLIFQRWLSLRETPDGDPAAGDALWTELVGVLERALAILGEVEEDERELATDAWLQLGYAYQQKSRIAESTAAFAEAIGLWPGGVDFDDLWARLERADFRSMMERAAEKAAARFAADSIDDALVWWWLGSARFAEAAWTESALAFERTAAKCADCHEAWYWAAHARWNGGDPAGATRALCAGWAAAPAAIAALLRNGGAGDRALVDGLVAWSERSAGEEERAALAKLRAETWGEDGERAGGTLAGAARERAPARAESPAPSR